MNKKAFTLAEVLITLTIIGVIAALTIPNLMKKWQDQADVQKVKQAYSILSNAMKMAIADNGNLSDDVFPVGGGYLDNANNDLFLQNLVKPYLQYTKEYSSTSSSPSNWQQWGYNSQGQYCTKGTSCVQVKYLNGTTGYDGINQNRGLHLKNGMIVVFRAGKPDYVSKRKGVILVDINGKQPPARYGYDIFTFPFGENGIDLNSWNYRANKGYSEPYLKPGNCIPSSQGTSCADWVIRKNNMDYKYKNVSSEWTWY